jgi:hypothetical protein
MTTVGILYNRLHIRHLYASQTLSPLIRWRSRLVKQGIKLRFSPAVSRGILDSDVVIAIDFCRQADAIDSAEIAALRDLRSCGKRILFLDNSDSCGTTQFHVMPYVDAYLKRQLYRDRSLYLREMYGLRLYTDFYHVRFGIFDKLQERRAPARPDDLAKLGIAWNSGLGDHGLSNRLLKKWNFLNFLLNFSLPLHFGRNLGPAIAAPARADRRYDIHYRVNMDYLLETISFGRKKIREILDVLKLRYRVCGGGVVRRAEYLAEIARSRVVVSPFGYGEICLRDFEAFRNGCLLVKPYMSHLETWPDCYKEGNTYFGYAWDFSDAAEKLEEVIRVSDSTAIAENGRIAHRQLSLVQGCENFCAHFARLVGHKCPESPKQNAYAESIL